MSIQPNECQVFIQAWVDVNALANGQTTGCYVVSNRSSDSRGEGTPNLTVNVVNESAVCWSVVPIDPQYNGKFKITEVSTPSGWEHPPAPVPDKPNVFTGKLQKATVSGTVNCDLQFSYHGENPITVSLPIKIVPVIK